MKETGALKKRNGEAVGDEGILTPVGEKKEQEGKIIERARPCLCSSLAIWFLGKLVVLSKKARARCLRLVFGKGFCPKKYRGTALVICYFGRDCLKN